MTGERTGALRSTAPRTERLIAKISADQKNLFQRAAELQGRTVTDFVIASAHEAVIRALGDMQSVRLTAGESRAFAEAVLNPREPSARLRAAAQRYIAATSTAEPTQSDP